MKVATVLCALCLALCGCSEQAPAVTAQGSLSTSGSPSATSSVTPSPTASPNNVLQHYEGCLDLASYFMNGGSSHDDLYDPTTDAVVVYSIVSRQFRITVADADCLHESPQVANQVRDAITSYVQHAKPDFQSALLAAAGLRARRQLMPQRVHTD